MKIITHKFNLDKAHAALSKCIMDLLEKFNTPLSMALAISFRNTGYVTVDVNLLKDPFIHPNDAHRYRLDMQSIALFKKSMYLQTGDDLEKKAVDAYRNIEDANRAFNIQKRFDFVSTGIIYSASRIIQNILGPVPDVCDLKVSLTSGATFSKTVSNSTIADKLSSVLDVTEHARPLIQRLLMNELLLVDCWDPTNLKIVRGSKFSTVPKDFRKRRSICKEPLGNMILQRGLGLHIRGKLLKVGINLEKGQDTHKSLLTWDPDAFSTIDQSDASDRITDRLVRELLPLDWYLLLNQCRCKETFIDGEWVKLEKFMTQGNGFTFELQTLIFYALCQAISINVHGKKTMVSVYGDDVIVPTHLGMSVVMYLPMFGLSVNTEKTFINGPFKESCGFDSLFGIAVRPFFLKEFEQNEVLFYIQLANFINRVITSIFGVPADIARDRAWKRCLSNIPDNYQLFGPESLGDTCINSARRPKCYYYDKGVLTTRVYRKVYDRKSYRKPSNRAILTYALLGGDSNGTLKRTADYRLESARAFPVNWD